MKSMVGKRILITGASGFIGSHLARRFHDDGATVIALEHTPGKAALLRQAGVEVITGDIRNDGHMRALLQNDIHIIIHAAAWLRGLPMRNYQSINVDATRNLAELSAEVGVERFIYISSIAVYGCHDSSDVDESTPLRLYGDPYGDSKIRSERGINQVAARGRLSTTIVRPGMVYGPDSPGWTIRMFGLAKRGLLPIVDDGTGTAFPIYVSNLVDLVALCIIHPGAAGEIFNAVDDAPITFAEFYDSYISMANRRQSFRMSSNTARRVAGILDPFTPTVSLRYVADRLCGTGQVSTTRAKTVLGWQPRVDFSEGMRLTANWLRQQDAS